MQTTSRQNSRHLSVLQRLWNIIATPQSLGVGLLLTGLCVLGWQFTEQPGIALFGRLSTVYGIGSAIAMVTEAFRRPQLMGRFLESIGMNAHQPLPIFIKKLSPEGREHTHGVLIIIMRVMLFILVVITPLALAFHVLVDPTLSGQVELTADSTKESFVATQGSAEVQRSLGYRLTSSGKQLASEHKVEFNVRAHGASAQQSVRLQRGERVRIGDSYLALASWQPSLSNRQALLEIMDSNGNVLRRVLLAEGGSITLNDGTQVTVEATRVSFLEMLGPAAKVSVHSEQNHRELWVMSESPDADLTHGGGQYRIRMKGLQPGAIPVLNIRDTPGIHWDRLGFCWLGLVLISLFGSWFVRPVLSGVSGDYLLVGGRGWFFRLDSSEDRLRRLEESWRSGAGGGTQDVSGRSDLSEGLAIGDSESPKDSESSAEEQT